MFRVMLVDDEPIAVDYLLDMLREAKQRDVELSKAYSGFEAIERMNAGKVDILLTDIRMPGMSGLDLADHTLKKWPRCKIIFLTGHNDFDYIQHALRQGSVDYVLKTEGDEVILQAIDKAIASLTAEIQSVSILERAQHNLKTVRPILRRDYLFDYTLGEPDLAANRRKRFAELEIGLDADLPVMIGYGRIDDWSHYPEAADRSLMLYSVHNIAEEYMSSVIRFVPLQHANYRFVWFIQPRPAEDGEGGIGEASWLRTYHYVSGTMEMIQATCRNLLKLSVSLALSFQPSSWEAIAEKIESLKLLLSSGFGGSGEMLVSDRELSAAFSKQDSRLYFAESELRTKMRKLDLLEAHLDNGEAESFIALFEKLTQIPDMLIAEEKINFLTMELFGQVSAFFISYLNRRNWMQRAVEVIPLDKLLHLKTHNTWHEAAGQFGKLGVQIAEWNGKDKADRSHDIIRVLHQYVNDYLHEELSLTRLSEVVYLSPPYLSRLYKQLTGTNLLDYLTDVRIAKAKHLLKTTELKVHEIAARVGFESAPYFTRLFKKVTNFTPKDYRDRF